MTLRRRTPLRAKPRAKGNRGELAVRDMLRATGWHSATRNWQSGGQGGGDLIHGPADVHVEVKWCERCDLPDWLRQAEREARPTDIPLVALRDNRHQWHAVLPFDEWAALHRLDPVRPVFTAHRTASSIRFWAWVDDAASQAPALAGTPVVNFGWAEDRRYAAVPLQPVLDLLWAREKG